MAIATTERFYDSCDSFSSSLANPLVWLQKFYGDASGTGISFSSTNARTGSSRTFSSSAQSTLTYIPKGTLPTTLVMGFALSIDSAATGTAATRELLGVQYQSTEIFFIRLNASRKIELVVGGSTVGTTTSFGVGAAQGSYAYVEVGLYLAGASSEIYVRINNTTEILHPANLAQPAFDAVQFRTTSSQNTTRHDDIYIHIGSGSIASSDFLGDIAVYQISPDANDTTFQWVAEPSATTTSYQRINAVPLANPPTSYLYEDTNNQKFFVSMDPVNAAATSIVGISMICAMGKGGFGGGPVNAQMKFKPSTAGTEYASSTYSLLSDYTYFRHYWINNPATTSAWTVADINAGFFGVEKVP